MLTHSAIALFDYDIAEQLYAGSRTIVYRGVRKADQQPVVIKLLSNEHPIFSELVQFRNQYTIAKNLNSPGIIQPYSLEPYRNGYALVMEDFGGISLHRFTQGKPLSLHVFCPIALQIADILQDLYRHRIIHKDIKLANILINPDTQQVKLIDFSIASLLPRETQDIQNPNILEGTLAYLSPEQTGRMNRGIDYRSDFYSLGVTFFELLTGKLPFQSRDPMELVHCHLAKQPPSIHTLNPEMPPILSEIVAKLMAKNAEDRYQSALGLKQDLELTQSQYQEKGNLAWFPVGQRDICDRFLIPERLYGREAAVRELLSAFNRVSEGKTELLLVAGFSGIGKTAVVNEVHKPIVRQRGYFIKGKYDQFNRNIPLSAFVQALRDLMGQLLSESDEQLAQWKNRILKALGENGQVAIEVIPELERIIGNQPPVPELSGSAAQNRFNLLFQKFIAVFTTQEHPLVMFLDDLQWADAASLNLIQVLMSQSEMGYLLLIGAYRDNEVSPAHPLMLTLEQLKQANTTANTLTLAALNQESLNVLVADTLQCATEIAQPLTQLIHQKTKGNPFFATQFLKALYEDGLISFDWDAGSWQCDVSEVRSLALTDDVVEFMAIQLQKLPEATQNVLKLAACIGNQFDLATLAIVSEQPETEAAANLWKALQEGLILPRSQVYKFFQSASSFSRHQSWLETRPQMSVSYKFLHDRIQQAAYSLIPDDRKQRTHLQIGRLLQQATPTNEWDQILFAIVNHLNKGASLIEDQQEQQKLVQLNLEAGRKAKSATAYSAALDYFNIGIALLRDDRWQSQYDLALAIHGEATESAYLSTNFEQMEVLAQVVLTHAPSWLDRVSIYNTKIQASIAQNQILQALQIARELLGHLGVHLPEQPTQADVGHALQHTQALLGGRSIESLLDLPKMTAPKPKAAMVILSSIMSAAYQAAPDLLPLLIFVQVDLSVQYGSAAESTYGYVQYGLMLIARLKDIDMGYCFGQLGINLLQRLHTPKLAAKTIFGFNTSIRHWREPAKDTLNGFLQAYTSGLETGDLEYVALSLMCYGYTAYFSGQELSALKQAMDEHRQVIQQFRQDAYLRIQSIYYQAILNLLEPTTEPDRLSGEHYDEEAMIQLHLEANQSLALYQLYFTKLLLSYLFQRYEQALENARLAEQYLGAAAGLLHIPLFYFYDALVQLAVYPTVSATDQAMILDRVAAHQEKLNEWASHAPSNQAHRCALVAAERCRVLRQNAEASEHYDRAIALAKANEYTQEEALANELAAKFYLDWGKQRIAQEYMIEAYYDYARWGAKAKVADLETRYPQLLAPILLQARAALSVNETLFATGTVTSTTSSSSSISDSLDLAAILKASQTLSGEIELGKLLSTLLQLVIENAGAHKCVLLMQDDRLLVQGLATVGAEPAVLQCVPAEESQDIPLKLIYAVKNRLEPVVLMDAAADAEFVSDPYFMRQQPKSILCSPILHQGKLLGIVYLENNLMIGAFSRDRVHILNLLCAQAAISLENARLYAREQEKSQALQASLAQLKQSESRAQQLFEQSTDPLCLFSPSCGFIDCNQAVLNLFGYISKDQFLSMHPSQISPEFQPDGQTSLAKADVIITDALHKSSNQFEWVHQRASGENFWTEITQTMTPYKGENILHTVIRDISDRKRMETSLVKERELLNAIIHNITDGIVVCDASGNLILFNNATREFHGLPVESLPPEQWAEHFDLYQPDGKTLLSKTEVPLFRALQGEIVENAEMIIASKQGFRRFLLASGQAIFDPLGNKIGAVVAMRDISDRKRMEAASKAFQERLTFVIEQTPLGVIEWNLEFKVVGWNPSAEKIFGYRAEEILDLHAIQIVPEADRPHVAKVFQGLISRQSGQYSLNKNICKDGSLITCEWINTPLLNAEGHPIGIFSIVQDISDRKAAELAIQQKSQALEDALTNLQQAQLQIIQSEKMSALGNLVAGVAHEINNPIGFIAGNLQPALDYVKDTFGLIDLYQQEYPTPSAAIQDEIEAIDLDYVREDLPKLIGSMQLGVDRICSISTSLRTFSRADKDYKVPFNIHEGIDSTILILKHRLKASESRPAIEVDTSYGNIPILECFPGQLNQVFMNILANAIDSLEEASHKRTFGDIAAHPNRIEIQTKLDDSAQQALVYIRDNGMGMSEAVKQRVFDHLFTTKAVGKGTGLGLAIARQIVVEKHGGTIDINSIMGEGTEFIITLPI